MNVQRVILLSPAVLGALATGLAILGVLPWVSPSFALPTDAFDGPIFQWKIRMDLISLACFAMSGCMALVGGFSKPVSWLGRLMIFVLSLVPLAAGVIILMNYSSTIIRLMDRFVSRDAELFWPGFATWLVLAASVVLLVSTLVVGRFGRGTAARANSSPVEGAGA